MYVVVEISDVNDNPVLSLGVINSWNCTAHLTSHNRLVPGSLLGCDLQLDNVLHTGHWSVVTMSYHLSMG